MLAKGGSQSATAQSAVNNWYTYNRSVPRQPFVFFLFLLVQYSISYMRYLVLYYQIGFLLDGFAQL